MRRKSLILLAIAGLVAFSACGTTGRAESTGAMGTRETTESSEAQTESVPEKESTAGAQTETAGNVQDLIEVKIKDDTHADFVFYGDGEDPLSEVTVLAVSFGGYKAVLNDYDRTGEFLCGVWTDDGSGGGSLLDTGKADYQISDDSIVIHTDMTGVSKETGFSFANDLGDCEIHYEYGDNGGPILTFSWEDIADRSGYTTDTMSAGSGTEQSGKEHETENTGEENNTYWFMGKTLDSHGGNWGASHITLSDPDENGLPTIVTVTDSGVDVMGNPLDGEYSITINSYDESENMDYLIGTYTGAIGAGIKGEFYDGNGKALTLQID